MEVGEVCDGTDYELKLLPSHLQDVEIEENNLLLVRTQVNYYR